MTKASVKNQQELDGFERESIPDLDEKCVRIMELGRTKKESTDKLKMENSVTLEFARELRDAGKLEEDNEGNHVYEFMDGEESMTLVVKNVDEISFRKTKKPKVDKPALRVVEDDGDEEIG